MFWYFMHIFSIRKQVLTSHAVKTICMKCQSMFSGENKVRKNILKCRLLDFFTYCPFDISWKDVFCLTFYFKWKYFILIDHILSETICLLCFCALFSNIYTKIKVTAKSLSDLCNVYSSDFLEFLSKRLFFTFLCWIWIIDVLQQYCENFRKIEQVELVENLAPLPTL